MSECRRCSECAGQSHHWIADPMDPSDDEFQLGEYACKHCDQRGDGCEACAGDGYLYSPGYVAAGEINGPDGAICEACRGEGVIPISSTPLDVTIHRIIECWSDWEAEANQAAQQAQSYQAGYALLHAKLTELLTAGEPVA